MTVLNQLASAQNRRDEVPNQALAQKIVRSKDVKAVRELVDGLANKDANIRSDCIKVLYEIGEKAPNLIAGYRSVFGDLLDSKNNRLVWGAMTALDQIALEDPKGVFAMLDKICAKAATGSVITRDHAVGILTKLGTLSRYSDACLPALMKILKTSPNNQIPMYAEMSLAVASDKNKPVLRKVFTARLAQLEKESQKKRVQKVLKRLANEAEQ